MDKIIKYFNSNHGYARMKDLKNQSFHPRNIADLLKEGIIEKVKPGLYKLVNFNFDQSINRSLIDICNAVPQGIVCLSSALSFYGLTTFNPSEVLIAIPNSWKPHKIIYPPVKFYFFRDRFYSTGILRIKTDGKEVRIYNKEKTVCDMFRYRNKLGMDIALEGLKSYLKLKEANINKLRKYAEICQVKTVMIPYVKAIVG